MKKYVVFSGRARRTEYWMFVLINTIFTIVAMVLDNVLGTTSADKKSGLFSGLFGLATLLPSVAVYVRRLHDVGKSGWWMFIGLIPIIGAIYLFVLTVTDSQDGYNEYGENPRLLA
jgi:uncharacterized membrane protein YhaH (DUF805 family)